MCRVCCMTHMQGVVLAQQYAYPQMEQLLARYANTMLEKDKIMDAIELYRKVRFVALPCAPPH